MPLFPSHYRPQSAIGRGATAQVFLAEGPSGKAAIKIANTPGGLRREREVLLTISHPHIARLIEADPEGDWLALEYAELGRADTWGRGQPTPVLVELAAQVAEALAYLHGRGLVHGDLKPSNVLVAADGSARLVDLGLARAAEAAPKDGGGTLGFIAPERLRGEAAGAASDLYGLGVLLYVLLTRQAPFHDTDPAALGYLPLSTLPEPPSSLKPRLPRDLDDLVLALLARQPSARPSPSGRVATLLRSSLATEPRPPTVGMGRERDLLRRHVVDLLEGTPGTVVLHGSAGSGRRTLIRECVRAAQREGVRVVSVGADRRQMMAELAAPGPSIVALDGNAPGVETLVARLVTERPQCLTLVRADRPMIRISRLGGRHICPSPLTLDEVTRHLEGYEIDRRRAEEFHRFSRGSPGTLVGLVRGNTVPTDTLDPIGRKVLLLLAGGAQPVPAVAQHVGLSEHHLLDLVEPMIDQGLLTSSANGALLRAARPEGA